MSEREIEAKVRLLAEQINLLCAGERMEIVLRSQQDVYCASICLVGSLEESLAFIDEAVLDLKATVRKHHAWYNSSQGQITSGQIAGGSA